MALFPQLAPLEVGSKESYKVCLQQSNDVLRRIVPLDPKEEEMINKCIKMNEWILGERKEIA